ncbi:MAG: phosphodiester glycosidase family protein [Bacteroidetes bacterium]|nr:phosphodiester glycosidase family protein [Bacteroidota bacterium]
MISKIILSALLLFPHFLFSQIKCDTLLNLIAADGVEHIRAKINDRHIVNLISINLLKQDLQLQTYRADSLQRTSSQVILNEEKQNHVIAALNGDFFSFQTGFPLNAHLQNGLPIYFPNFIRTQLLISDNNKPFFENSKLEILGIIKTDTFEIDGVNKLTVGNKIKLYNKFGALHKIKSSNNLIGFNLLNQPKSLDDTLFLFPNKLSANIFPINYDYLVAIPENKLSQTNLNLEDTLKVIFKLTPQINNVKNIISGFGHLLKDNAILEDSWQKDNIPKSFKETEHPRTLIGFNSDTTKFYFIVADGRQTTSTGMSFKTMVEVLQFWEITNALNLDGGGSSTMVIHNKIVNSPSDISGERSVANSLQLISKAPLKKFILDRKNYLRLFPN